MSSAASECIDSIALGQARAKLGSHGKAGTAALGLPVTFIRELTKADLPALSEATGGVEAYGGGYGLREIKASHHLLAMTIASGASDVNASFITGYQPATIRTLKRSPMFIELVAYYTSQKDAEFKDFHRKAAAIGMDALDVLHERILTEPEKIKFDDLRKLAETLMDRTVLPSKAASGGGALPQAPAPITVIQFIDSPNRDAPRVEDPRLIEGTARAV